MALKTQKTAVWFRKLDGSDYSLVKVGKATSVGGLSAARSQIPVTDLEDETDEQYIAGLRAPGAMSVALNYDTAETSHEDLEGLYDTGEKVLWIVGLSDGAPAYAAPTVDEDTGVVTYPTSRTFISFDGFISDFPLEAGANDAVRSTMTVQRSGPRTVSRKSA